MRLRNVDKQNINNVPVSKLKIIFKKFLLDRRKSLLSFYLCERVAMTLLTITVDSVAHLTFIYSIIVSSVKRNQAVTNKGLNSQAV